MNAFAIHAALVPPTLHSSRHTTNKPHGTLQVYSEEQVQECIDKIGFPMIIKPTSGAGSMGVYKVSDPQELLQRVKQLLAEQQGDEHSNSWVYQYDAGIQPEAPIVAETFVTPQVCVVFRWVVPRRARPNLLL